MLLAALIVVAFGAVASAAKLYSTSSETTAVGSGQTGIVEAACPGEKTAVAGGFDAEFRIGDPVAPAIRMMTFRRDQDAWFVTASNGGPGGGELQGLAYCARRDVSISFAASRVPGSTPAASNAATCPKTTVALSGGYVSELAEIGPYALRRTSTRTWQVSAANVGPSEGGLTAYVVCSSREDGDLKVKTARADAPLITLGAGVSATATAKCGAADERVVSGGFEAPSQATGVLVHRSKKVGERGWRVTASAQTPVAGTVTAYAYCIRG